MEVIGLARDESTDPDVTAASSAGPMLTDSYDEWIKSTRAIGLDFGKSMLTASAGSVAVYFAVLKYLGADTRSNSIGGVSAIPALLFLGAVAAFAIALRPQLAEVGVGAFEEFRRRRLRRLNNWLTIGLGLFILALTVSVAIFVWTLAN